MKSSGLTRGDAILALAALAILFLLASLLFPSVNGPGLGPAKKAQAKNDVTQIATAVMAYNTEYDHLPPIPINGLVSGELISVLVGSNQALNPRNIQFIEISPAKEGKRGLQDGTFVDPWGGPYRIAIATATNNSATITAGTNQVTLRKLVAVWNDPATHPKPFFSDTPRKNAHRYVTSWE